MDYPYNFRGIWEKNKTYNKYDIVLYENSIYMALTDITIQNNNLKKNFFWQVISRGIVYKSRWKLDICYYENNIVKYNDDIFICLKDNKNLCPNKNPEYWELFISKGKNKKELKYYPLVNKGTWNSCYNYQPNNIVKYEDSVYIALLDNISKNPKCYDLFWGFLVKDGENCKCNSEYLEKLWNKRNLNIKHVGKWKNDVNYVKGDLVRYNNATYIVNYNHKNDEPKECSINWGLIAKDCNNCDIYGYSKILHATINNGIKINKNCNISTIPIEKNEENLCIDIEQYGVDLQFKIIEYNTDYYYINMENLKILFVKCGKYRITYNIMYISPVNFNICTYLNGDTYINTGYNICSGSLYGEEKILNHSFYINIGVCDINKVFKLFYINNNNNMSEINDKIIINTENSWITMEYIGL